jgi:flagellar motor switch protein FliN/FliY
MSENPPSPAVLKFFHTWQECFASLLEQIGVASPAVAVTPSTTPVPSPEEIAKSVCIRFSGGGVLKGEMLWLADTPVALQLGQLLKSEPLDPSAEFNDGGRDAFAERLRQVAGMAATAWKQESGGDTEIIFQAASDPSFVAAHRASLRLSGEKIPDLSLDLLLNADLCDALSRPPAAAAPDTSAVPADAPPAAQGALPANLDLLLDVELEATIRFGQREMLLRDIFGLMAGAVVELNQSVNEPAELLVAGRLVARGEVVVVDGNFGLRVTEVASTGQRAELLQF